MKKIIQVFIVVMLVGAYHTGIFANISPQEILAHADRARGNVQGIQWIIHMESVEGDRQQERKLMVKARGDNSLAKYTTPAKVKGQKILMIDRNMWFVKPGLSKPVPLSPRQKLMGGAANGDIASTNYAGDYEAVSITDEMFNEEACYVLDLKATNKNTTYDRIQYWVSKKRLVGVKADFFTVSGKCFKSAVFEYDNSILVNGASRPFVSKMIITDAVIKGNVTTLIYDKVTLKKIPDSAFNLNLLIR
ncbi:outer membrane lipoprotein-sorting protein [Thermodesulfobacteriota bacterium]